MTTPAIINDALSEIPDIAGLSIRSPLDGDYPVTQAFGVRSVTGILHRGIDQSCPTGTRVLAVTAGTVSFTYTGGLDMPGLESDGSPGGYGSQVRIDHPNGVESRYGHLSEVLVRPGQYVEAGALLGLSGTTGISTGPHLHWEMRWGDTPFDPSGYIGKEIDDVTPEDRELLDWLAANKGALSTVAIAAKNASFDAAHDSASAGDHVSRGIRRQTRLFLLLQAALANVDPAKPTGALLYDLAGVAIPAAGQPAPTEDGG